ncbi:hypothetical protein LJC11_02995 [Bacteroidales bacterium OttesenSCG-928-I21]|nr:hypothetical protein [Bacteroidales bacterium OttesenSCG-928-I21]
MKDSIKQTLQQLVGLEFTRTTRTANMECLKFGVLHRIDHKGIERQIGEFGLHLECPWRFTKKNIILVGNDDLFEQPDEKAEYDENFNWDIQGGNLRDVKLDTFLKSAKYIVKSVNADNLGGFELKFNRNIKLSVFPTLSSKAEYSEYWRLLDNKDENKNHFVVGTTGINPPLNVTCKK